jgi:hypothetical protein
MLTRKSRLGIPTDDPIMDAASGSSKGHRGLAQMSPVSYRQPLPTCSLPTGGPQRLSRREGDCCHAENLARRLGPSANGVGCIRGWWTPADTVFGGHEKVLRQTVVGMKAGARLAEHENPGEATVLVLHGRVRLSAADQSWDAVRGDLLIVPDSRPQPRGAGRFRPSTDRGQAALIFATRQRGREEQPPERTTTGRV